MSKSAFYSIVLEIILIAPFTSIEGTFEYFFKASSTKDFKLLKGLSKIAALTSKVFDKQSRAETAPIYLPQKAMSFIIFISLRKSRT